MEDVAQYAQKALVMNDSRVFMYDDVEKVFSHAAQMEEMGLSIPQVSKIFLDLAGRGYPVNPNVFTVESAKEEILRLLGKGGESHA